ncbi:hypothetical protein BH23BAC3_BH23BAC3_19090 [soil metagenome]
MTDKEISQQITRYIQGELNDEEEDQLWVEFLMDQQRFRQFETELNLYDLFQNKGYSLNESDFKTEEPNNKSTWLFAVAAVVLMALSIYIFNMGDSGIEDLAVSQIELSEMLGSDVYRDDRSSATDIDYEINSALATALGGKLDEAYQILSGLDMESTSAHEKQRVYFNQGVISYNQGNYNLSVTHFSELTGAERIPEYMKENALWYKANGYLKLQDEANASETLRQLIEINAQHAEKAGLILHRLDSH